MDLWLKLKHRLISALFWDNTRRRVVGLLTREDGTDMLSRNVGKELPHDVAQYPRRAQISSTTRRKPEIKVEKQVS
jgi:hypothetical protein